MHAYALCVCVWYLPSPEEGVMFFGTRVMDGINYNVGSGNTIHVLCKSNKCS